MTELTAEGARALFNYDAEQGLLTWKVPKYKGNKPKAGDVAGCLDVEGYRVVRTGGKDYKAHRIAYLMQTGQWPSLPIDHRNGKRDDNRWENLRLAEGGINQQNRRQASCRNKTGLLGVTYVSQTRQFRAIIDVDGRKIQLGRFDDAMSAHQAYMQAKVKIHPGYAP